MRQTWELNGTVRATPSVNNGISMAFTVRKSE